MIVCMKTKTWILRAVVTGAVMAALLVYSVPAKGSSSPAEAAEELRAALNDARKEFDGVDDWPQWFRDRVKGESGYKEFRAWVDRVAGDSVDLDAKHQLDDETASALWTLVEPLELVKDGALPDRGRLRTFLEESESLASEVDALLEFDCLVAFVPQGEDVIHEIVGFTVPPMRAIQMLLHRCQAHVFLGNYIGAWSELARLGAVLKRFRDRPTIVSEMTQSGLEDQFLRTIAWAAVYSFPSPEVLEAMPYKVTEPNMARIFEAELVFKLLWFGDNDVNEPDWAKEFVEGLREQLDDDEEVVEAISFQTKEVRELLAVHRHFKHGEELPAESDDDDGNEFARRVRMMDERRARAATLARRANLALELRRAETDGAALQDFEFDEEAWPGLKLERVPEDDGGGVRVLLPDVEGVSALHLRPLR
jgi:hypothetical protein